MAGLLTTIGICALFFLLVILPLIKWQRKFENKYGIKAKDWELRKSVREEWEETMPTSYSPRYSDLPGNIYYSPQQSTTKD